MKHFTTSSLLLLFLSAVLASPRQILVEAKEGKSESTAIWTCDDDLTPNLCDTLEVETKRVDTRDGLSIRYWRYYNTEIDDEKNRSKLPIININGGPGLSHDYDLPIRQLACNGHEVVFYDQGGTGKSSIPDSSTLMEYPFLTDLVYLSTEELPLLLQALGYDEFHVVADGFGTFIALQFALDVGGACEKIRSMVLSSSYPDLEHLYEEAWNEDTGSVGTLPTHLKQRLLDLYDNLDFGNPEFKQIQEVVRNTFYYRSEIIPDCFLAGTMREDIFMAMKGAADYLPTTGSMEGLNLLPRIKHELKHIPAFVITGGHDIVPLSIVQETHQSLPMSELVVYPESGHLSLYDASDRWLPDVGDFLRRVEESDGSFLPQKAQKTMPPKRKKRRILLPSPLSLLLVVLLTAAFFALGTLVGSSASPTKKGYHSLD